MKLHHFTIGVMALALTVSCVNDKESKTTSNATQEQKSDAKSHSDEIIIRAEQAKNIGLAVKTIKPASYYGSIPVGGKIVEASGDERTVVASTSGIVSLNRQLTEGTRLNKGVAVMNISANNLQGGSPTRNARIAFETAKKDYERATKMVDDNIISKKEFNAIKAQYEAALVAYKALPDDGKGGVSIVAPISGYVKSCNVKDGDYVTVGQPMLSITQNKRLYLRAELPEKYYDMLEIISSATFKPSYSDTVYDLNKLNGRIVAVGKTTTASPGYIPITFEFNNAKGIMPGAFAEIWLQTSAGKEALAVPVSAITEEQGAYFVYIKTDASCYKKQEVKIGMTNGELTEIIDGLKGGEQVVTEGAVNVKLAASSNAIPAHNHNH